MDKEYLIKKWLADELTVSEKEAFESLDDHDVHVKILDASHFFKASEVSDVADLESFYRKFNNRNKSTKPSNSWYKPVLRIAAALIVLLGIGSLFYLNDTTNFETHISERLSVELPDASTIVMNSKSEITFNKNNWQNEREVTLDGEAFFKVAKGSTFDVITNIGTVSVLGTQFNVKSRKGYFEVQCFEGLVNVLYKGNVKKLSAGTTFKVVNELVSSNEVSGKEPQWIENISSFKSVPYYEVIKEFERQYDVVFTLDNIDTSRIFTGGFIHTNIEDGLKSITLPLDLEYNIESNKYITLYNSKP